MHQQYEPVTKGTLALLLFPVAFVLISTGTMFAYVLALL